MNTVILTRQDDLDAHCRAIASIIESAGDRDPVDRLTIYPERGTRDQRTFSITWSRGERT